MARTGLDAKAARIILISLGMMVTCVLCGCPGATKSTLLSKPLPIVTETSFVHAETGVSFSPVIDGFRRGPILQYDQEGRDISVGYDFTDGRDIIVATVYVYPAPKLVSIGSPANVVAEARWRLIEGHFQRVKHGVVRVHPDAVLKSEEPAYLNFNGKRLTGLLARYEYEDVLAGVRSPVTSEMYLFQWNEWFIKFRNTYTQGSTDRVQPSIHSFMDAIEPSN